MGVWPYRPRHRPRRRRHVDDLDRLDGHDSAVAQPGHRGEVNCDAELWHSDTPTYDGEFVRFRDIAFGPKPIQKPHPPIWMGGDADAVLRSRATLAARSRSSSAWLR
jgi:alkanesulfonate monooxygenase SsuD/methylene tetrahydromethanopterin reductase-like flavin-dependent oxidoreductase (luciferase family)